MILDINQYNQSFPMCNLPHNIYSVEGVRHVDRAAIDGLGISGYALMTSAAMEVLDEAFSFFPEAKRWQVFCGAGNNGGDGFVLVRHLYAEGIPVEAVLVGDPTRLSRDAASNWRRLETLDVTRRVADPGVEEIDWLALLSQTSVAVDALFGTGLKREITGGFARGTSVVDPVPAGEVHLTTT